MRTLLFFLSFVVLLSCKSRKSENPIAPAIPAALDDNNSHSLKISKRYDADLVTELYQELLTKDTLLEQLQVQLDARRDRVHDTLQPWNNFNAKNHAYYQSAESNTRSIQDTLIRERIKKLVAESLAKYESATAGHVDLVKAIQKSDARINDLYILLTIFKTLPIMEKYQHTNMPDIKPVKQYLDELQRLETTLDSLSTPSIN